MNDTITRVREVLEDSRNAAGLAENPAAVFRQAGVIDVPADQEEDFKGFVHRFAPHLAEPGARRGPVDSGCAACKISAYTVAAALVALGTAALAELTVTSSVVAALAALAGVSARAALAYIRTLAGYIASGIDATASAICRWMGAC